MTQAGRRKPRGSHKESRARRDQRLHWYYSFVFCCGILLLRFDFRLWRKRRREGWQDKKKVIWQSNISLMDKPWPESGKGGKIRYTRTCYYQWLDCWAIRTKPVSRVVGFCMEQMLHKTWSDDYVGSEMYGVNQPWDSSGKFSKSNRVSPLLFNSVGISVGTSIRR